MNIAIVCLGLSILKIGKMIGDGRDEENGKHGKYGGHGGHGGHV